LNANDISKIGDIWKFIRLLFIIDETRLENEKKIITPDSSDLPKHKSRNLLSIDDKTEEKETNFNKKSKELKIKKKRDKETNSKDLEKELLLGKYKIEKDKIGKVGNKYNYRVSNKIKDLLYKKILQ
jgi:hypothetical protein